MPVGGRRTQSVRSSLPERFPEPTTNRCRPADAHATPREGGSLNSRLRSIPRRSARRSTPMPAGRCDRAVGFGHRNANPERFAMKGPLAIGNAAAEHADRLSLEALLKIVFEPANRFGGEFGEIAERLVEKHPLSLATTSACRRYLGRDLRDRLSDEQYRPITNGPRGLRALATLAATVNAYRNGCRRVSLDRVNCATCGARPTTNDRLHAVHFAGPTNPKKASRQCGQVTL